MGFNNDPCRAPILQLAIVAQFTSSTSNRNTNTNTDTNTNTQSWLTMASPWRIIPTGLALRVRATPKSRTNGIKGTVQLVGSDEMALSVSTTAAPDGGTANASIVATLAKELGVSKSCVRIVAGQTARVKRVEISGDVEQVVERLKDVCG
jgi:uncharacterized protein YggU (UPF0235/DUF167 family)